MEYSIGRTLELRIEDDEIDVFIKMLNSIKKGYKKTGFNKTFDNEQREMFDSIHYNLIGQHEED